METKMNPLEVVAFAFVEPEYARQEYFKNKQKESGYSVTVFVKKLEDAVKILSNEAHKNDSRSRPGPGGFTVNPQVYLYNLTKGQYNGSINDTHLFNLLKDIYKAFQETEKVDSVTNTNNDNEPSFYKYEILKLWYERECAPLDEHKVTNLYNSIQKPSKRTLGKFIDELNKLHSDEYKSNGKTGNPQAFAKVYKKLLLTFSDDRLKKLVQRDYDHLKETNPTKQL